MGKLDSIEKLFSLGEMPGDPVVSALKRFSSWLKHILGIELMLTLIFSIGIFAVQKVRKGEVEQLIDKTVEVAQSLHFEETPPQCPDCNSMNLENKGGNARDTYYKCLDCGKFFKTGGEDDTGESIEIEHLQ